MYPGMERVYGGRIIDEAPRKSFTKFCDPCHTRITEDLDEWQSIRRLCFGLIQEAILSCVAGGKEHDNASWWLFDEHPDTMSHSMISLTTACYFTHLSIKTVRETVGRLTATASVAAPASRRVFARVLLTHELERSPYVTH